MATVTEVRDTTFQQEVLDASLPVLVDFWAPWCGPCRAISPLVEEMAKAWQGKLKVVKFNVEDDIQTPQRYGITAIPSLFFFKSGAVVHSIVGAPSKAKLDEAIRKLVA
jgi:thioredoxin 1